MEHGDYNCQLRGHWIRANSNTPEDLAKLLRETADYIESQQYVSEVLFRESTDGDYECWQAEILMGVV